MPLRIFCFNKAIFKKTMVKNAWVWGAFLLYVLFSVPFGIFTCTMHVYPDASETMEQAILYQYFYVLKSTFLVPVCFVMGIVSAMMVFHFLFDSRSAHAFHSYPVSREGLFFTNYIAGFLFFTIPLFIGFFSGAVVCGIRGITSLEYLFYWIALMEGMIFFFYNMAILVEMFTGVFLMIPVLMLGANYAYVAIKRGYIELQNQLGFGLDNVIYEKWDNCFSPLYQMNNKVLFSQTWDGQSAIYHVYGARMIVVYCALALMFGTLAFFLYRKRKVECVGDMVTSRFFHPLFRWILAYVVSVYGTTIVVSAMSFRDSRVNFLLILIGCLFVGCVFFLIAEMILEKSVVVLSKKFLIEGGAFLACMCVLVLSVEQDWSGEEKYIPSVNEVEYVKSELFYFYKDNQQQGIQELMEIQKDILEQKDTLEALKAQESYEQWVSEWVSVQFQYCLKNGKKYSRTYELPMGETGNQQITDIRQKLIQYSSEENRYFSSYLCKNYSECTIRGMSIDYVDEDMNSHSEDVDEVAVVDELMNAIKQDVREGHMAKSFCWSLPEHDKEVYYNGISIELYHSDGIIEENQYWWGDDDAGDYDIGMKSGVYYIGLNTDCVYTLEVLEKYNLKNNTNRRFYTIEEYEQESSEEVEE